MTREQIEKKGMDYFGFTGKSNDIGSQVRELLYKAFVEGAKWRINSVWHSTDELPDNSGFLAVLMSNGIMEIMYYSAGIGFHEMQLKGYVSWAYVSDLLPVKKEETK